MDRGHLDLHRRLLLNRDAAEHTDLPDESGTLGLGVKVITVTGGNATGDEGDKHRRLLLGNFFGSRVFRAPVLHASARPQHALGASRFHPHNYRETYLV